MAQLVLKTFSPASILAASCADTVETGDSAAPSTTMALTRAPTRHPMFFVLIGIFDIVCARLRSALRRAAGRPNKLMMRLAKTEAIELASAFKSFVEQCASYLSNSANVHNDTPVGR